MCARISKQLVLVVGLLVALAWSSPRLHAEDWYVDALTGADTNDGQSAAAAWRTLTHALAAIPSLPLVAHTIHVAPGVYDAALGEVYPLWPRPLMRIVGTEGSAVTILDGGGKYVLIYIGTEADVFEATSGAEGLTLRNGLDGLTVLANASPTRPAFRDLRIEGMSGVGFVVEITGDSFGGTTATPTGDDLSIEGCGRGVKLLADVNALVVTQARIVLSRTLISASASTGLAMVAGEDGSVHAWLDRCRVVDNGADGVKAVAAGITGLSSAHLEARASLIAGNGGCGAYGDLHNGFAVDLEFEDCTIAGNALAGVRGVSYETVSLRNCVVAGNADDIDVGDGLAATRSCAQDGDLQGFPGCIAADPLFVDASNGDFRLRFGSPCIESGDPASAGALDLLEHARPVDGDLDTLAASDMGAFEHEPLHVDGTPHLGAPLRFELWGAPGASARLFFTLAPLVDPVPTPFGELRLDRPQVVTLGTFAIPAPPRVFVRRLPEDPAFLGTSVSFQALTTSAAAPQGSALTDPVSFVIEL